MTKWTFFTDSRNYPDCDFTDSIGNVYVKNGKLHIVATKNTKGGKKCSSGRISTIGKQSFLYGKIEVKAKAATGKGLCPAIWMLMDNPKPIPFGEIDIMEYIECFEGKQYCTTIHIVEQEPEKDEIRHKHSTMVDADIRKYHVYTLEWTPEALVFKLDGKTVYTLNKTEAEFWPFDHPYYLIMNVTYGNWGAKCGMDDNILPREMVVDWVKYYRLIK